MTIRMRVLPRFPARISGISGIATYRDGPDIVVMSDYGSLVRIPAVANEATTFFKVWNADDNSYSIMTFEDVFAAVADLGFLDKPTYDPTNKSQDIFAYADVAKAAAVAAQATANAALPKAGGVMTGAIQDLVIAPSSASTKKAAFDLSLVTAGQQRAIKVPDFDTSLGIWEPIGKLIDLTGLSLVDWTNLSAFRHLRLTASYQPSVGTGGPLVRDSIDNGANFRAGASDYAISWFLQQGTVIQGTNQATSAQLAPSSAATDSSIVKIKTEFSDFNKATTAMAFMSDTQYFNSGNQRRELATGYCSSTTARNALRFAISAGTFTKGSIFLEGVRG